MEFPDYVRERRPALMRFATVLTGQAWLADDLVGDVLGRAYERWDTIGTLDHPHAYVRRMIVNEHLSWRRRLQRSAPADDLERHAEQVPDGADDVVERNAMIARLDALPRRQRAAVVLRYYAQLTDAEIADELGCAQSTVRSQIARALRTLRLDTDRPAAPRHATVPMENR